MLKKYLFITLGMLTLTLGICGTFTPMLPVTPFMLLTGYLFAKSSPRLHEKLLENKFTGYFINRVERGMTIKERAFSLALMWCMVSFTAFFILDDGTKRYIVIALGVIGTIAQLIVLGKRKRNETTLSEISVLEQEPSTKDAL